MGDGWRSSTGPPVLVRHTVSRPHRRPVLWFPRGTFSHKGTPFSRPTSVCTGVSRGWLQARPRWTEAQTQVCLRMPAWRPVGRPSATLPDVRAARRRVRRSPSPTPVFTQPPRPRVQDGCGQAAPPAAGGSRARCSAAADPRVPAGDFLLLLCASQQWQVFVAERTEEWQHVAGTNTDRLEVPQGEPDPVPNFIHCRWVLGAGWGRRPDGRGGQDPRGREEGAELSAGVCLRPPWAQAAGRRWGRPAPAVTPPLPGPTSTC